MLGLANGGLGGGTGAKRPHGANQADQPPSDPARASPVSFKVNYGVRWGANRANRGVMGGGGPGAP